MRQAAREAPIDFGERYRGRPSSAAVTVERRALGSDVGATGYTTRSQAEDLAARLELSPAMRVLDLGSGRGWPSIFLAETTGCRVISSDLTLEGPVRANERADSEGIASWTGSVVTNALAPAFRPGSFDVVVHSDLLC